MNFERLHTSIQFQLVYFNLPHFQTASWQPVHDAKGQLNVQEKGGKGEEQIWAEHDGMTAPYNPPYTTQTTSWRELE